MGGGGGGHNNGKGFASSLGVAARISLVCVCVCVCVVCVCVLAGHCFYQSFVATRPSRKIKAGRMQNAASFLSFSLPFLVRGKNVGPGGGGGREGLG